MDLMLLYFLLVMEYDFTATSHSLANGVKEGVQKIISAHHITFLGWVPIEINCLDLIFLIRNNFFLKLQKEVQLLGFLLEFQITDVELSTR